MKQKVGTVGLDLAKKSHSCGLTGFVGSCAFLVM
jgi:hypothetical protein